MPRYFFYLYDSSSKNLVRDSEGVLLSGLRDAKNEAIGLGKDIARLGIDRSTWQVLVIDENGDRVLRVPLSEIRARKFQSWIDLAHRIATYEPRFRSHVFTYLLMAAVLAMIGQAVVLTPQFRESGRSSYHLASVDAEGTTVDVRFVPRTSLADIEKFLRAYNASLVNGPLRGGWYRLRIADSSASPAELKDIASKMKQEDIVSLVAVGRIEDAGRPP
jgi:hypothetical protein